MSPVHVTFRRTIGRSRGLFSTAVAVAGFMAVAAVLFAFGLESAEGGKLPLGVVWATSVAPVLPALAALLGMDVWSDERQSGRIDLLLTTPVRERDFAVGKFLGVYAMSMLVLVLFQVSSFGLLVLMAPHALADMAPLEMLLALFALGVQNALWCAVAVAASALFCHAATAACLTLVLLIGLPRGLWAGLKLWAAAGPTVFGEMPLDAHVADMAAGFVPVGTVLAYLIAAALVVGIAAKTVAAYRLVGRGARTLRLSTGVTILLALVLIALSAAFFHQVNPTVELSVAGSGQMFSQRTRNILSESSGTVTITAFQSRRDPLARLVETQLRALRRVSNSVGGTRIELRFVDPRWDIGAAERLVRRGLSENTLIFSTGRRSVSVPVADGVNERVCASTIRRLSSTTRRHNVYWTVGHGEVAFDDYGVFGMSDIVRDLHREGYGSVALDLATNQQIPSDCALILVAGARDDFSRVELGRLNAYLREGGRLMVLQGSARAGGVNSLLPSWGLRPVDLPIPDAKTLSGTDVIVSDFADHPVSVPLKGSRIVLERPVSFVPSSVAELGAGADRITFAPVAEVGSAAVVAAVERGVGAGADLAVRPMRIVAVGDASFVLNGQLKARAGANRDFFLNAVAYLSGADAYGSGETEAGVLSLGMDRAQRQRFVNVLAAGLPLAVFLLLTAVALRRRRA